MKATAVAHPIQGIVKYHGLKDEARRIPYHDSISLCTGPITSRTTVEVLDSGTDAARIDGRPAAGRSLERVRVVVDEVRRRARDTRPFRMRSENDFPQFVGLGSSSSGFAALAVAAAAAYGWDASPRQLSEVARLGAGSASRAVTGGLSEWVTKGGRSYARCLVEPKDLRGWRIVVPLVPHPEPTEGMHREAATSPLFAARVASMPEALRRCRAAAREGDLEAIMAIAEHDTLSLHAITMTGMRGHVIWRPATVAVIHAVRELRASGVPVWFSIDTGATAYLNTTARHAAEVARHVRGIPGVERLIGLQPGGAARLARPHVR